MAGRRVRLCTLAVLAVAGISAAAADDSATVHPLRFVVNQDPDIQLRGIGRGISPEPPFRLAGRPAYALLTPQYSLIRLGEPAREHVYVMYGSGAQYDMFCIDANGDGDLGNDRVHTGTPNDRGEFVFAPVEVTVRAHGLEYPYRLVPTVDAETGFAHLRSGAYCAGDVVFGGTAYPVAVFDDNYNGLFGDRFVFSQYDRIWLAGDALAIDLDRDGRFDIRSGYSTETFYLGRYLAVDGELYEIDLTPNGRSLTVHNTVATHGYVAINSDRRCAVELVGMDGPIRFTAQQQGLAKAPADMFGFHAWHAEGKMPQGATWKAVCYGDLTASVTVLPRSTTQLELPQLRPYMVLVTLEQADDMGRTWSLTGRGVPGWHTLASIANGPESPQVGPPLKAVVSCQRKGGEMEFSLRLEGCGGETYGASEILKDGKRVSQPRLRIMDARGDLVHQGRFKYG